MSLYRIDGVGPELPPLGRCFIAPGSHIVGKVRLGEDSSIWFNVVVRGDADSIEIGARANIQDNSVLHADPGFPLIIGADVTVGHSVILHGCTIGEGAMIGMGATIMNGAKIGRNCLVGANALITEGKEFPDHSLILGAPARVARILDERGGNAGQMTAAFYVARAQAYSASLELIAP